MKFLKFVVVTALVIFSLGASAFGQAHVPAQGSAERRAIIDGLKAEYKQMAGPDGKPYRGTITFDVKYIKVSSTWA